tara:strand:- start:5467 stop:6192 length:726 start_codon:yes stop_codon:yes gene_type:complete
MNYNSFISLIRLILPRQIISLISRLLAFLIQNVRSGTGVIFDPKNKFEGDNFILTNTKIYKSKVGRFTYISSHSLISNTIIGRYSSIGNWVNTGVGRHPTDFVSTHPLFHSSIHSKSLGFESYDVGEKYKTHKFLDSGFYVEIGSDVWIGDRVTIMDGITIGDGAIIGTGSIVTKNVQPYEIVVGVPAKHLRYRFTKDKIEFLLSLKWWEKDKKWIKNNANLFSNINDFQKNKYILKDLLK